MPSDQTHWPGCDDLASPQHCVHQDRNFRATRIKPYKVWHRPCSRMQQPCGFSPFPQRTLRPNSRHRVPPNRGRAFKTTRAIPDRNSIPDQKLDAAAAALEQVANVREDYQQRMEAAAPSDRPGIADEGKNALVKAITNHGLSVEEYTSILVVAQNDPVVREKILQRVRSSPK